ncbi:MAG: guanylate kinase, partial [Synergistaceae bacterium]|nr:guanylate kinase [Synergistaceae bacterium]
DVVRELEAGHDVLLEIDVQGALQVREKMPDAVLIFVAPPSVEVLERRLRGRGTEAQESLNVRLENALKELALKDEYDYIIVNDDLHSACEELRKIIL